MGKKNLRFFFPVCIHCGHRGVISVYTFSSEGDIVALAHCAKCNREFFPVLSMYAVQECVQMAMDANADDKDILTRMLRKAFTDFVHKDEKELPPDNPWGV